MSEDKQEELLMDIETEEHSLCCDAGIYGDYRICKECGEHC